MLAGALAFLNTAANLRATPNNQEYRRVTDSAAEKDAIKILAQVVENDRRKILDVTPTANTDIAAFVIHVEEVSMQNSGIAQNRAEVEPIIAHYGGLDKVGETNWYKAYAYVDFYSSCLPFPKTTQMMPSVQDYINSVANRGEVNMQSIVKAFGGDLHSILRISRFPYFLVPKNKFTADNPSKPEAGRPAKVRFLDTDNYSYGVFLGTYELKEFMVQGKYEKLPSARRLTQGDPEAMRASIERGDFDKPAEAAPAAKKAALVNPQRPAKKTPGKTPDRERINTTR